VVALALAYAVRAQQVTIHAAGPIVLHAARLLQVDTGALLQPGEILVEGDRIRMAGTSVDHPPGARIIDLGDATLLPGLIDAHVHLFLHPGAEDLQTVEESVPWRTILAEQAAKADLLAGFTAERDMGTEGAGSADSAVRDAINQGLIPEPRLRASGNAIDILGGHEDAIHFNPAQHILSNADYANSIEQLDCLLCFTGTSPVPLITVSNNHGQSLSVTLPISKSLIAGAMGFESVMPNWNWEAEAVLKRYVG
jgi:hypothetical protein